LFPVLKLINLLKIFLTKRLCMQKKHQFTAVIEREDNMYVALCPELDIASQGENVENARANLIEAIELFFETASQQEIRDRLHDEVFITRLEIAVG
jgi:predicted RNase H-like HicB family nuclease